MATDKRQRSNILVGNVLLLSIVSFLTDMSSEMILPILPLFLVSIGGTGIILGLIGGVGDSVASILKVFSGYFSDKLGKRKILIYAGYQTSAVSKLFFAFVTIWQHLLILRPIERLGKGIRTAPRDALIAESIHERGKGFGIHRAFDTAGAIIGSLLALLFIMLYSLGFRTIFLIAGGVAFIALIPLIFLREKKSRPLAKSISLHISFKEMPRSLKFFMIIATLFALGNFSYFFFILRAQQFFSAELAIIGPLFLYVILNIVYAAFCIPSGILSDKVGRPTVLIVGYALFGFVCIGFAQLNLSLVYLVILFILYGFVFALVESNQRAFVSDLASEDFKGTALGIFHTAIGLAVLPGSVIAGFLWDFINPMATFLYGATLAFLAVISFVIMENKVKRKEL
ncbi:MAG: MFS transporter [Promethearchaeota archaeon]